MIFPKQKGETYEGYIITCGSCETDFFATMDEITEAGKDIIGPDCPTCGGVTTALDLYGEPCDSFVKGYYMGAGWVNKEMVDAWNKACIEDGKK